MAFESEKLARAWIDGWNAGKPESLPLAENFTHTSPLGVLSGRKKYLDKIIPMAAKNVTTLKIIRMLSREGEAAMIFEMGTPNGPVQVSEWIKTHKGEITEITSFYDTYHLPHRETY